MTVDWNAMELRRAPISAARVVVLCLSATECINGREQDITVQVAQSQSTYSPLVSSYHGKDSFLKIECFVVGAQRMLLPQSGFMKCHRDRSIRLLHDKTDSATMQQCFTYTVFAIQTIDSCGLQQREQCQRNMNGNRRWL